METMLDRLRHSRVTVAAVLCISLLIVTGNVIAATPIASSFDYEGRLGAVTGQYDFLFRLYDAPSGGNLVSTTVLSQQNVLVFNGEYLVVLDWGYPVWSGQSRYIEVRYRTHTTDNTAPYTTLANRQSVNPVAYALHARIAEFATNATKLGGYTHAQMATMSIPVFAAYLSQGATMSDRGPLLSKANGGKMNVGFVVPPDHVSRTPISVLVVYEEDSDTACSWYVYADGLAGPTGPNSGPNLGNGGWTVPGTSNYDGAVLVPAGPGQVQSATFTKPAGVLSDPGMIMDFDLLRAIANAADTCGDVIILGIQVSY